MVLRNVDTPDNTPGAGFAPMLTRPSRTVESVTSLIQIVDQWHDVEDAVAYSVPDGSVTLPVLSATIGYRPVISVVVPAGKIFIPEFLSSDTASVLQCRIRITRRFHFWAFSGANVAAPATPTTAVNVNSNQNFPVGAISYKITALNNVGETTASAATANVTTGAATSSVSLTVAAPAGSRRIRIYRTTSGNGTAGPWFLLHELDAAQTGYRDVHPDSDLDVNFQPPVANTTTGNSVVEISPNPVPELQAVVQDVALAATPARIQYIDDEGLQEDVSCSLTLTANTQTLIKLKRADVGFTGAFDANARMKLAQKITRGELNAGLSQVINVVTNPATGQYNLYGLLPVHYVKNWGDVAPTAGNNCVMSHFYKSVVFPPGSECIVEMAHGRGAVAAAAARDLVLCGRMLTI